MSYLVSQESMLNWVDSMFRYMNMYLDIIPNRFDKPYLDRMILHSAKHAIHQAGILYDKKVEMVTI